MVIPSDLPLEKKYPSKCQRDRLSDLHALVGSSNLQNTIGVDIKRNLNLRDTTKCRRDARKFKLFNEVVVLGQTTFALENMNQDDGLVVSSS